MGAGMRPGRTIGLRVGGVSPTDTLHRLHLPRLFDPEALFHRKKGERGGLGPHPCADSSPVEGRKEGRKEERERERES